MKRLDPINIFSAFENDDQEVLKEHGIAEELNNSYVLLGMVLRGLEQYELMDIMYTRTYGRQYKEVRENIKDKYYVRLYGYLSRIDSSKFTPAKSLTDDYSVLEIFLKLNDLLKHFEVKEHYEKCATIYKYQNLITERFNDTALDF